MPKFHRPPSRLQICRSPPWFVTIALIKHAPNEQSLPYNAYGKGQSDQKSNKIKIHPPESRLTWARAKHQQASISHEYTGPSVGSWTVMGFTVIVTCQCHSNLIFFSFRNWPTIFQNPFMSGATYHFFFSLVRHVVAFIWKRIISQKISVNDNLLNTI